MKNHLSVFLLLAVVLVFMQGCSAREAGMTGVNFDNRLQLEPLDRSDYRIKGEAKGSACVTSYSLFPLPVWWNQTGGKAGELYGVNSRNIAQEAAYYEAIESSEEADAILVPRYRETSKSVWPWYTRRCVTVRGKTISVLED